MISHVEVTESRMAPASESVRTARLLISIITCSAYSEPAVQEIEFFVKNDV